MSLSKRGLSVLEPKHRVEYYEKAVEAWKDTYHPENNPNGFINLSVAENKLSALLVSTKLSSVPVVSPSLLTYDDAKGSQRLRCVLASFLQRHVARVAISPEHIVVLNGSCSVINNLAAVTCDPGQYVIVCGPGYRGFQNQLHTRAAVNITIANLDEQYPPVHTVSALQAALDNANGKGHTVRAVLICSPHNPTGEVLTTTQIRQIVSWARTNNLHIIFDEVYALSVHHADSTFHSVAEVLQGNLGQDVHVVWSLSKDFCASGLRVGILLSQNTQLMKVCSFDSYAIFSSTSRLSQWAVMHMLSDIDWVNNFISENKYRLRLAYQHCVDGLNMLKIPFIPSAAGFFLLADFRKFLPSHTAEAEINLWRKLCEVKVLLSPSCELYASKYGFFRICFAAIQPDALKLTWKRLQPILDSIMPSLQ